MFNAKIIKGIPIFLSQAYPYYYRGKTLRTIVCLLFIMAFCFGYIFEPFNVYFPEHKMNYFWISFIHASVPLVILLSISVLNTKYPKDKPWNIGKEILFATVFILLIGISEFLIRDVLYMNSNNWSWNYLFEEIRHAFLVGMLFVAIIIPLNLNRLYDKNRIKALSNKSSCEDLNSTRNTIINIETQLKSDSLSIDLNSFIFAKADGNYIEIYLKTEKVSKLLKRITIKELESIFKPYSHIIKTHRSYLVNTHHVKNITGNAQGYKLQLNNCDQIVPVSRNMIKDFDQRMNNI